MGRRVYFSYDHDGDMGRADQIRSSNAVANPDMEGFFGPAEYAEAAKQGQKAIQDLIERHLQNTSVTVVLIGADTAKDPWVKYEIDRSIEQKNGLFGIYIGHLRDVNGRTPTQGLKPPVPSGVEFPAYSWNGDPDRFVREILAAGKRADALRMRAS